jgi:hypothetical protein
MAQEELVRFQGTYQVSSANLITECDLFKNKSELTMPRYQLQRDISLEAFQDFMSALDDKSIHMNDKTSRTVTTLVREDRSSGTVSSKRRRSKKTVSAVGGISEAHARGRNARESSAVEKQGSLKWRRRERVDGGEADARAVRERESALR